MLEELFRLKGGAGAKTRLFADLSASARADLARMATFAPEEAPVVAYFADESEWFLITTGRVMWLQGENQGAFDLVDLDRVDRDIRSAMERRSSESEDSNASVKDLMDRLRIHAADGRSVTVSLEPGQPFLTMSGVLGSLCRWASDWRQGRRW